MTTTTTAPTPQRGSVLELEGITRRFGTVTALDDVSFTVSPGRLTGFVGANGAGKTTTMRTVLGIATPDAGEVRFGGAPVGLTARQSFGYMPEERGLYPKMPVLAQLVFLGQLYGLTRSGAREAAMTLLERVGLAERSGDRLDSLSLGNQQRVQVVASLVHDPVLLLLDEPFSGLDPVAVDTLAVLLRERAAAGVPVLFSSHQLELVEALCDDVVILDAGRVVAAGRAGELRESAAPHRYRIVVEPDAGFLRELAATGALAGLKVLDVDGPTALVELGARSPAGAAASSPADDQALLRAALERGPVREMRRVVPTLAELYREATA